MDKAVSANGSEMEEDRLKASFLEDTGERYLPEAANKAEQTYDHISRYRLAERYVQGKQTIDLGSGAGYGTYSLAAVARNIVGIDLSEEAVGYSSRRYQAPNLRYGAGSVTELPYRDGSFEAAVSFEVIEHLERPEDLVLEARRVLKEDGVFVVSTPDKAAYSNDRNSRNPHHLKEMYPREFREILERHFEHVQVYRQGSLAGAIVSPEMEELPEDGRVTLESARFWLQESGFGRAFPTTLYVVAVCTNGEPPEPLDRPYLILDRDRQIYEEYFDLYSLLGQIQQHDKYKLKWTNKHLQDQTNWVRQLQDRVEQMQGQLQKWRAYEQQWQKRKRTLESQERELQEQLQRLQGQTEQRQGQLQRQQQEQVRRLQGQVKRLQDQVQRSQRREQQLRNTVNGLHNSRALKISRGIRATGARLLGAFGRGR